MFDLQEELLAYISDVDILKRCCVQFRELFMQVTSTGPGECGVDPFQKCITIASACNLVFRRNFLAKDTIAVLPPNGYNASDKQSKKAMTWLRWISRQQGVHIQHAQNGGEMHIGKYKMDGISEEGRTVYEFNGCFWHGCPKCYNAETNHPVYTVPKHEIYTRTKEKQTFVQTQTGLAYVEM